LAASIQERLNANDVEWRVDTEFVLESRIPEVRIARLAPEGRQEVSERITDLMKTVEISSAARVE
jgi:predicted P-loop ATPase/GTPase